MEKQTRTTNEDKKTGVEFHNNNLDVKVIVGDNLKLEEDEVVLCLGIVQGNYESDMAAWTTAKFSIKNLDRETYTNEVVEKLICLMFHKTAVLHNWISRDG